MLLTLHLRTLFTPHDSRWCICRYVHSTHLPLTGPHVVIHSGIYVAIHSLFLITIYVGDVIVITFPHLWTSFVTITVYVVYYDFADFTRSRPTRFDLTCDDFPIRYCLLDVRYLHSRLHSSPPRLFPYSYGRFPVTVSPRHSVCCCYTLPLWAAVEFTTTALSTICSVRLISLRCSVVRYRTWLSLLTLIHTFYDVPVPTTPCLPFLIR